MFLCFYLTGNVLNSNNLGEIENISPVEVPSTSAGITRATGASLWNRTSLQTVWDFDDEDFQQPKRRIRTQCSRKRRNSLRL